jgi:hypothetical protein
MARINVGRVFIGGLVSGIVLFLGDLVANNVLMKGEWEALVQRMGIDPAAMASAGAIVSWVLSDLLFGVLIVWTYAAIRPRFGAGPKTAVVAGMMMFVAMIIMTYGFMAMGALPESYFIKSSLAYLVIMTAAAAAGGYFYREE